MLLGNVFILTLKTVRFYMIRTIYVYVVALCISTTDKTCCLSLITKVPFPIVGNRSRLSNKNTESVWRRLELLGIYVVELLIEYNFQKYFDYCAAMLRRTGANVRLENNFIISGQIL